MGSDKITNDASIWRTSNFLLTYTNLSLRLAREGKNILIPLVKSHY